MKTLDETKHTMASGDTAQADGALKELLAKEPDNLQAKMLYGTCRQLLGDEETFKRIHDELALVMGKPMKEGVQSESVVMWKTYHRTFTELTSEADEALKELLAKDPGRRNLNTRPPSREVMEAMQAMSLYAGPPYYRQKRVKGLKLAFVMACVVVLLWLVAVLEMVF